MTGKQYFLHIKCLIDEKESIRKYISDLEEDASAVGGFDYSKPMVQTSPRNTMEEKIIKLADQTARFHTLVEIISEEVWEAEERLSQLSRPECAQAIRYRFIFRKRIGWIADEIGYTERQTKRIISDGLSEFEKRWLKDVPKCPLDM